MELDNIAKITNNKQKKEVDWITVSMDIQKVNEMPSSTWYPSPWKLVNQIHDQ